MSIYHSIVSQRSVQIKHVSFGGEDNEKKESKREKPQPRLTIFIRNHSVHMSRTCNTPNTVGTPEGAGCVSLPGSSSSVAHCYQKRKKKTLTGCSTKIKRMHVGNLQVILRPNPSTNGRSNQQRLFLSNL